VELHLQSPIRLHGVVLSYAQGILHLFNRFVGRLNRSCIDWWIDWLNDWLVDRYVDRLFGYLMALFELQMLSTAEPEESSF